jgi:hypothetical protein
LQAAIDDFSFRAGDTGPRHRGGDGVDRCIGRV